MQRQVKNLEHRLQEAMRGESGRNALIKQVAKLESEVKHVRERLELRHCEALVSSCVFVRPIHRMRYS